MFGGWVESKAVKQIKLLDHWLKIDLISDYFELS